MGATDRTYVSGRFALDLNGGFAGFLSFVEEALRFIKEARVLNGNAHVG